MILEEKTETNIVEIKEDITMVSIYQQKINDEKEKARVEGSVNSTYELALSLSNLYNRTFESMLDDFKVTPEVRKICMERYRKRKKKKNRVSIAWSPKSMPLKRRLSSYFSLYLSLRFSVRLFYSRTRQNP